MMLGSSTRCLLLMVMTDVDFEFANAVLMRSSPPKSDDVQMMPGKTNEDLTFEHTRANLLHLMRPHPEDS